MVAVANTQKSNGGERMPNADPTPPRPVPRAEDLMLQAVELRGMLEELLTQVNELIVSSQRLLHEIDEKSRRHT
jgi:hypothetical protein